MRAPAPVPYLALSIAATAAFISGAQRAEAQDFMSQDFIKPGEETVSLDLGGIVSRFDTTLQLNGQGMNGSNINLESNGLKKDLSSFEAAGTWRFWSRNRVDAQYFATSRSGSHNYGTEIDIGSDTFPVGATVSAEAKDRYFSVDYRYSFVKSDAVEVAGLLGFYGGHYEFNVSATGNEAVNPRTINRTAATTVPLPLIGLTLDWYVNPRWKISGQFDGFKAKINNVDGKVIVVAASTEYMLVRNLGIGLRYMYLDTTADVTKSDFNGSFTWKTNNVSLYGKLMF